MLPGSKQSIIGIAIEVGTLKPVEIAHNLVYIASDLQAEDIVLLDISHISSFADYFVILTAGTNRQSRAMRDDMVRTLKEQGVRLGYPEGRSDSGWMLLDFGDVIVHIFSAEKREYYNLEELWGDAAQIIAIH